MFEPGKVESGWQDSGIDILCRDRRDGGRAESQPAARCRYRSLLMTDLVGRGIARPDRIQTSLKIAALRRTGAANEGDILEFRAGIMDGIGLAKRTTRRQALCYKGGLIVNGASQRTATGANGARRGRTNDPAVLVAMTDRIAARGGLSGL